MYKCNAMRRILFSLLIGCMGIISGYASTAVNQDGKTNPGPGEDGNNGGLIGGRPLIPSYRARFHVSYDSDLSALVVYSPSVDGQVYAVLQNLTFGTSCGYVLADGDETVIPITVWGTEVQRLTVILRSHYSQILINCQFYINDGMIVFLD